MVNSATRRALGRPEAGAATPGGGRRYPDGRGST